MIYLQLFLSYFQIGLFSIGGGHAALPMVSSMLVDQRGWLTLKEFADMVTISIMAPGTVALNTATFVGFKMGGLLGAIVAVLSCILPAFVIIIILSYLFKKYCNLPVVNGILNGVRPAVTGLIASAGLTILFLALFDTRVITEIKSIDIIALFIAIVSFIMLKWKKLNPVLVIFIAGAMGIAAYGLQNIL